MKKVTARNRTDVRRRSQGLCVDCGVSSPLGPRCTSCKEANARERLLCRIRAGEVSMRLCWRCQTVHPHPVLTVPLRGRRGKIVGRESEVLGERYCYLAPEWNGWPWKESDDVWTYPEAPL